MQFHEKITTLRKERKWSQAELAPKLGIHVAHLSKVENGKSIPSLEILKKLTLAFGVTADYLLHNTSDDIPPVKINDKNLVEKINLIESLDKEDKSTIINVIEAMLTKKKMLDLLTKSQQAS